jgi:hypothetical protein
MVVDLLMIARHVLALASCQDCSETPDNTGRLGMLL